ncbi:MAG: DUF4339 domain-containing protein [Paludibacteraceae bacterium]|nr:DUF4339 domain-containing protein [Paludibacteraceae bacterium]
MGYGYLYRSMSRAMQPKKVTPPKLPEQKMAVYVLVNGQQAGPFNKTELAQLVKNGTLQSDTLVWEAGMAAWGPANTLPHVLKLLLLNAPKRKEPKEPKAAAPTPKPAPEPKAEHSLRADLIDAMGQLGFRGADVAKSVDALLDEQPEISSSAALKILLKMKSDK